MPYYITMKRKGLRAIKNRLKNQVKETVVTFDSKISECFKKVNIKGEKITIGDLLELKDLSSSPTI